MLAVFRMLPWAYPWLLLFRDVSTTLINEDLTDVRPTDRTCYRSSRIEESGD